MVEYPTDLLPQWSHGYRITPSANGVSRTEFSTGRARQRMVGENRDDQFGVSMLLTPQELMLFDHFVEVQLNFGDAYIGPYHDGGGIKTGVIRLLGGEYKSAQLANANLHRVTATLEVIDREVA